ncbi:MAG: hypothetical protein GY757_33640 [bacterium]|nr:hypothetical protein [bacterium]
MIQRHDIFTSLIFLLILLPLFLTALNPHKKISQYTIQVWNMEAGLPGNSIFAIQQTNDGFLWLGTQNGLVRFDGTRFRIFNRENSLLKDNSIHALLETENNALWIGTSSGGLTLYKNGRFTTFSKEKHKSLVQIKAIARDRWGNLWIGSLTHGLTCMNDSRFIN